jgi:long-chain acyl-CoA synthetase
MLSVCVPLTNGGGKAIFTHKWDPTLALEIIQKEKVNQMTGVPTQVWQLLEHPRIKDYDLKSMSVLGSGGAPAAAALPKTIVRVIPSASTANG